MTEEEVRAYYDDPANAEAMCDLLMAAHPGWKVWRVRPYGTFRVPRWCAHRGSWSGRAPALMNENAGLLNQAIFMVDAWAGLVAGGPS